MPTALSTTQQIMIPGLEDTLGTVVRNVTPPTPLFIQVEESILSSGNWTRPNNIADFIEVTWVGGGGSGGASNNNSRYGGGGGAGQFLRRIINIATIPALGLIPVKIGNGGSAVSGATNGNNGGNTQVGSGAMSFFMIAYGGGGGGWAADNGRDGNNGSMGPGADNRTGQGSGGGGGSEWQRSWGGAGGGGGASMGGMFGGYSNHVNQSDFQSGRAEVDGVAE